MKRLVCPEIPEPAAWLGYLQESYEKNYFSNFGPNVVAFEHEIQTFLSTDRQAVTVSSATAGITAGLMALGIKGQVAIPSFTFPATASAVYQAGCTPIAVDVDIRDWEISEKHLATVLDRYSISAVVHVRSFGFCRDLTAIATMTNAHDIPLLVDAAAAFGGRINNRQAVGGAGVMEIFSFHATKPFGIGEGGVVMAEPSLAAEIRNVTNFAMRVGPSYGRNGINGKMSEVHAAIGRAALKRYPERLARRRDQALDWIRLFEGSDIGLPHLPGSPPWQVFPIRLIGRQASAVRDFLGQQGFESRVYYEPALATLGEKPPKISSLLAREMLSLPIGPHITADDRHHIVALLR